jgi:DNA-binding CsgD family transcriptional regulator
MLDDEIVMKNVYYWAKRMVCKGVDFNELVSIGYIVGKPLSDARLLKDWIRFSMLKYIMNEHTFSSSCVDTDDLYSLADKCSDVSTDNSSDIDLKTIMKNHLSDREILVLSTVFYNQKTQSEAAKILNITQQTVNFHIHNALEKMKLVLVKDKGVK